MRAVVVVRNGKLPAGGDEVVAECDGRVLLIGSGVAAAVGQLDCIATDVLVAEAGTFRPAAWATALARLLVDEPIVVLPGSPDGRDLAPRLAVALGRPCFAPAMQVAPERIELIRLGGRHLERVLPPPAFVAVLAPGLRGVERTAQAAPTVTVVECALDESALDAEVLRELPADAATVDLGEAPRIVAGGAGLDAPKRFDELAELAVLLGASIGATRVITDRGWVGHERQIGTTGVVVAPDLYLAFGISGAVQHTSGLGTPAHVITVNTDPHCPMMHMSDLAVVADANAVLAELLGALRAGVEMSDA